MRPVNTVWSWLGSSKWRVADTMLHSVANGTYTHATWITRPLIAVDAAKHSAQLSCACAVIASLNTLTGRIQQPVNAWIAVVFSGSIADT